MRMRFLLALGSCWLISSGTAPAASIALLPGLQSVDFIEGSGGASTFNFAFNSAALTQQLAGALSSGNSDFNGLSNENYDVYYSDADGTLNPLGAFISIQASFVSGSSSGLNIDSVRLNFLGGGTEFASVVSSFVSGVNYVPGSELNALGATNSSFTAMGRTTGTDRMRVTVGFPSSVPEPSTWALMGSAMCALGLARRSRGLQP